MSDPVPRRPLSLKGLVVIEVVFAFVGLMSGYAMLSDPSGEGMGLTLDYLENAPVGDYALVGLFFVLAYGILPAVAAFGLWKRPRWTWTDPLNKWTGQHWSWTATVALGAVMLIWILVEVVIVGLLDGIGGALQAIVTILGIGIILLATRPSVRNHLKLQP